MCALSTDSQKTYSLNTLVAAATYSTGGNNLLGGGGVTEKTRIVTILTNDILFISSNSVVGKIRQYQTSIHTNLDTFESSAR